jgi:hypothetical protein
LLILPEDDANRQIATGFSVELGLKQVQIDLPSGGWRKVLAEVRSGYLTYLNNHANALLAIVIDFDGVLERIEFARKQVPAHLHDRVFVLGAANEPEDLKRAGLGSYEAIGAALARDCLAGDFVTWGHQQLRHNLPEAERLRARAGWLFSS